jgi:hypothetical protein
MLLLRPYALPRQPAAHKQPEVGAQLGKLVIFGNLVAMLSFSISARLYATSNTGIAYA